MAGLATRSAYQTWGIMSPQYLHIWVRPDQGNDGIISRIRFRRCAGLFAMDGNDNTQNVGDVDDSHNEATYAATTSAATSTKPEEKKTVNIFQLFRFATKWDRVLQVIGTICAIFTGLATAINIYFLSLAINAVVLFDIAQNNETASGNNSLPTSEIDTMSNTLWPVVWKMCVLAGAVMVSTFLQVTCWTVSGERQARRIRAACYRSLLSQEMAWFDQHSAAEMNTRITSNIMAQQIGIGERFGMMIMTVFLGLGGYMLGMLIEWRLVLIQISTLPLFALLFILAAKILKRWGERESNAIVKAGAVAEQALYAIHTVIAYGGQSKEMERYSKELNIVYRFALRKGLLISLFRSIMTPIVGSGIAIAFWYSSVLAARGEIVGGELIATMMGGISGFQALLFFVPCRAIVTEAQIAATNIYELIDMERPSSQTGSTIPDTQLEGRLEFEDVRFCYPSRPEAKVLDGLSLCVSANSTVAIVGSSGCGKSTIMQLLQRLYTPDQGKIILDGHEVSDLDTPWFRSLVGVVSQEPVLFSSTVSENIRHGLATASEEQIEQAAQQANAYDFIMKLPKGFTTLVGERGAQLSAGQKQRIAIARALVRNPKILLLDEATSALDNESEAVVQVALEKARQGRTTIVVAHRLSTIRNADLIVSMQDGVVVEMGTHAELVERDGVYSNLIQNQDKVFDDPLPEDASNFLEVNGHKSVDVLSGHAGSYSERPTEYMMPDKEENATELPTPSTWRLLALNRPELCFNICGFIGCIVRGLGIPAMTGLFGLEIMNFGDVNQDDFDHKAILISVGMTAIAIVLGLAEMAQYSALVISGERFTRRLRFESYAAILHQDLAWFDDQANYVGALTTRLTTDTALVKEAVGAYIGNVLQGVVTVVVSVAIGIAISWKLGLVVSLFGPPLIVTTFGGVMIGAHSSNRSVIANEEGGKIASEILANIRTVRSLEREAYFVQQYFDYFHKVYRVNVQRGFYRAVAYSFSYGIRFSSFAVCFYYGGYLADHGDITGVDMVRVYMLIVLALTMYATNTAINPDIGKARTAAAKILHMIDTRSTLYTQTRTETEEQLVCDGKVGFTDVEFRYPTRKENVVLDGIHLSVGVGETLALVGSSGCGKSTCIQLLLRFYDASEGELTLDGRNIQSYDLVWYRRQLGLVSQEPVLFDISIRDNIAYGDLQREVTSGDIVEAARAANIHDFVSSLPQGYDTCVGEQGSQLSAGQKQRVAIARALLRNPRLLLLDEATSALDTASEKVVQEALDRARIGRTCVVIAHRLSTIQNADQIAVIHHGRIVEQGTHQELLARAGHYYHLYMKGRALQ